MLLKDKEKRSYWIELLANSSIISNHSLFLKLLQDSLKYWLDDEKKKEDSDNIPFHSKVIELASSDTFANASLYHQYLLESMHIRHRELWLSNKEWKSTEIGTCAKINCKLWSQISKHIDNIPKVEDLDEKNMESASKNLCSNLEYCLECRLWFEQENPMQPQLFTLFDQVLTQLVIKNNFLPIHVYEYLIQHWKVIKDISSHCSDLEPSLQKLDEILNDYREFSKLISMFKRIHSDYLLEHDLSGRLKIFRQQSDTWETQVFLQVKENYRDEIQLLKSYEQKMKLILKRRQSLIFNKIWENCNTQYAMIIDQEPLFIFNKVFDDMDRTWEDFKQVHSTPFCLFLDLQSGSLKYKDLEWVSTEHSNDLDGIKKCLIAEMEHLFPEYKDEQQQIVDNVEQKLKKEIALREQLPSWIELKKVTEQMKEYHPHKDKIKKDEKWKKYVKTVARMEE
ncbi:hypothetical protein RFI_29465, partial [Reticulomyxa filosa]